jgi:hypothetical protein
MMVTVSGPQDPRSWSRHLIWVVVRGAATTERNLLSTDKERSGWTLWQPNDSKFGRPILALERLHELRMAVHIAAIEPNMLLNN